ncbi:leukocyte elastase inhibitor-like [Vanessa atalanta]|uniref:leukocyte elastase inhibitor-like n=1 Tax=Vanessa atalanta TaxID=42275 RepID=UPI001FCCEC86|nr:leukocyte elastase inhibitor-like [Vanessa atalanta]
MNSFLLEYVLSFITSQFNIKHQEMNIFAMVLLFLFFSVTLCYAEPEFSSRPTNVSLLLIQLTHEEEKGPVVLGPFGLWNLMAGISFGASSVTKRQINRAFKLSTDREKFNEQYKNLTNTLFPVNTSEVKAWNENYIFVDKEIRINTYFIEMLMNDYFALFTAMDFQDQTDAAHQASQIIKSNFPDSENVFSSEDFQDSSFIMSNVLWFEGSWSSLFNISHTKLELVNSFDGRTGSVSMMQMKAKVRSSHMEAMKATVTELPYGNDGKYCMLLLFPDPKVSMEEVYSNFDKVTFRDIFAKLQSDEEEFGLKEVEVKLPRFAKRSKLQLRTPLNRMGIFEAFERKYARFSHIAEDPYYIESIEHNVVVMVAETGTIAYATTPGMNRAYTTFRENKVMPPFTFFIIEKPTATVLFGGIF